MSKAKYGFRAHSFSAKGTVLRQYAPLVLLIAFCWCGVFPAVAEEITGVNANTNEYLVEVQATGSAANAEAAKSKALADARWRAFVILLERIAPDEAADIARKVTREQAATLVKSSQVRDENSRAEQYAATVAYLFDEMKVGVLLLEATGISSSVESDALLILPVYEDGGHLMLWETENAWRNTLNRVALHQGQGKLIMPFGDPKDTLAIDHQTVLSGHRQTLARLATRYGTKNVVIALARNLQKSEADQPHLEVVLRRAGANKEDEEIFDYPASARMRGLPQLMKFAAEDISVRLLRRTGEFSLFYDEEARQVQARVIRAEFHNGREWSRIRQLLENLPNADYLDLGAVAPGHAQLTLFFKGPDDVIREAIRVRGLDFSERDGYWVVALP